MPEILGGKYLDCHVEPEVAARFWWQPYYIYMVEEVEDWTADAAPERMSYVDACAKARAWFDALPLLEGCFLTVGVCCNGERL